MLELQAAASRVQSVANHLYSHRHVLVVIEMKSAEVNRKFWKASRT